MTRRAECEHAAGAGRCRFAPRPESASIPRAWHFSSALRDSLRQFRAFRRSTVDRLGYEGGEAAGRLAVYEREGIVQFRLPVEAAVRVAKRGRNALAREW